MKRCDFHVRQNFATLTVMVSMMYYDHPLMNDRRCRTRRVALSINVVCVVLCIITLDLVMGIFYANGTMPKLMSSGMVQFMAFFMAVVNSAGLSLMIILLAILFREQYFRTG